MSGTPPKWLQDARDGWKNRGVERPSFAVAPKEGEESVWDYPRPPALVSDEREVRVTIGGQVVIETTGAYRVLETSHPPTFYLPPEDTNFELLVPDAGRSFCEWKGEASYWAVKTAEYAIPQVGWSYAKPFPEFQEIKDYFCFYPGKVDCFVGGEKVISQPGGFYGGWITSELVGPFKGEAGTSGW